MEANWHGSQRLPSLSIEMVSGELAALLPASTYKLRCSSSNDDSNKFSLFTSIRRLELTDRIGRMGDDNMGSFGVWLGEAFLSTLEGQPSHQHIYL